VVGGCLGPDEREAVATGRTTGAGTWNFWPCFTGGIGLRGPQKKNPWINVFLLSG